MNVTIDTMDSKGCSECADFEMCLAREGCVSGVVKRRTYSVFFMGDDCFEAKSNNGRTNNGQS